MSESIESYSAATVRQICRWGIPTLYLLMILFWASINIDIDFYLANHVLFSTVSTIIFIMMFGALGLTTTNQSIKVGACCILVADALIFINLYQLLENIHLSVIFDVVQDLLFFAGVVIMCRDTILSKRMPRLVSVYIFILGVTVIAPIYYRLVLVPEFVISFGEGLSNPILLVDTILVYIRAIVAILFWFKLLKLPCIYRAGVDVNPVRQPAVIAVTLVAVLYYLVCLTLN